MADWREELGSIFKEAVKPLPLSPKSVSPQDRIIGSGEEDKWTGITDELGNREYQTPDGRKYFVRAATQEERDARRSVPEKVTEWWNEGANLPSGEEVLNAVASMPRAYAETVGRVMDGSGTYTDLLGSVGPTAAPGVASRVGTAFDPSVVSAMGATHKVPRYLKKEKKANLENLKLVLEKYGLTLEQWGRGDFGQLNEASLSNLLTEAEQALYPRKVNAPEVFNDEGLLLPETPTDSQGPIDFKGQEANIQFRDPIDEILAEMELPKNGITGAQLLKELQDNPTVRNAQLKSQGVLDRIDPAKRYTSPQQDIGDLLGDGKYTVQAVPQNKYDSYQRQPVQDKELNYVEYAINADREGPTFKANSQHFQDSTLAHVRLSERENASGNYVLIEELQSDLLQKGFVKPSGTLKEFLDNYLKRGDIEAVDYTVLSRVDPDELARYSSLPHGSAEAVALYKKWSEEFSYFSSWAADLLHTVSYEYKTGKNTPSPPVAKTEEAVRLGIETAMAHAAQNGIDRVVIPPFERIVEQRFSKGSEGYDKAMDPKSGFYQTYVSAVNKVLKKLNEDVGVDVEVKEFDLQYGLGNNPENLPFLERVQLGIENERDILRPEVLTVLRRIEDEDFTLLDIFKKWENGDLSRDEHAALNTWRRAIGGDKVRELTQMMLVNDLPLNDALYYLDQKYNPPTVSGVDNGIEINFSNAIKNGYDLTRPRFAEGGVVENQTPVPPGATPKEVADDVPIMASEGEYVIPANVVRYLGLDKIEKLVNQAKEGLAELEAQGRVGGDTGPEPEEDLPFSPEELQRVEAPTTPKMAEGGMVLANQDNSVIDPNTGLPLWLVQMQQQQIALAQPAQPTPVATPNQAFAPTKVKPYESSRDRRQGNNDGLTGTAQSVAKWTPAEFNKYAETRNGVGPAVGRAALSMIPGAGLASRLRQRYLERNVPTSLQRMIESKTDLQGNALDDATVAQLQSNYDRISSEPVRGGGLIGGVRALAENSGLVKPRATRDAEPARLRDVFSGGKSSSPRVSSSDNGLVKRPDKTATKGGKKTSAANTSNSSKSTSEKKK